MIHCKYASCWKYPGRHQSESKVKQRLTALQSELVQYHTSSVVSSVYYGISYETFIHSGIGAWRTNCIIIVLHLSSEIYT
jgi:hypothetical protein